VSCPSCGAANEPGDAFCGECGSPLSGQQAPPPPAAVPAGPAAERRLVSVLFADPGRVHDALRVARLGGGPGAPLGLLRALQATDRALRRHRREVHWHDGTAFRPTGPIETLEVPETLHALVAARLDGLFAEERRLVQGASVLGKTFTKQGIGAVSGLPAEEVDALLAALLRKKVARPTACRPRAQPRARGARG
jgi:zinc-ribbon domain